MAKSQIILNYIGYFFGYFIDYHLVQFKKYKDKEKYFFYLNGGGLTTKKSAKCIACT